MTAKLSDLKKQISEKNMILNALDPKDNIHKDEIKRVRQDLDYLLYLYYKSLAYNCSDMLAC